MSLAHTLNHSLSPLMQLLSKSYTTCRSRALAKLSHKRYKEIKSFDVIRQDNYQALPFWLDTLKHIQRNNKVRELEVVNIYTERLQPSFSLDRITATN